MTTSTPLFNSADLSNALRRAFNLGQTYWRQADSESYAQNRRSDDTRAKFETLVTETIAALAAQQAAPSDVLAPQKYDDVLIPFVSLMRRELHANAGKGDRPGWLRMDASTALLEIYWHAAKLSAAVKNNDGPAIMEYSADVANMAMMVLDVCGGLVWVDAALAASPPAQIEKETQDHLTSAASETVQDQKE